MFRSTTKRGSTKPGFGVYTRARQSLQAFVSIGIGKPGPCEILDLFYRIGFFRGNSFPFHMEGLPSPGFCHEVGLGNPWFLVIKELSL